MEEEHQEPDLISIGTVARAFGVHGAFKVKLVCEPFAELQDLTQVWFQRRGKSLMASAVISAYYAGEHLVLETANCHVREAVAAIRGAEVMVESSVLPPLDQDEFYTYQLVGMEVVTKDGRLIGRVEHILETASMGNDVLVIGSDSGRETLVPAMKRYVHDISLADNRMVVAPLETFDPAD